MKSNTLKTTPSYWTGIIFSLLASFGLSVVSVVVIAPNSSGLFSFWAPIAGFITLLGVMVVGIPVVLALKEFKKDTCLNAGLAGGYITFIISLGFSGLSMGWLSYVAIVYGFTCGFTFMFGIKQDLKK